MALAAPAVSEMFAGVPAAERVDRFEAYKSALSDCHAKALAGARNGTRTFQKGIGITDAPANPVEQLRNEMTTKGISADQAAEVSAALERIQDIQKDWSLTNPLSSNVGTYGLVPYDLDPALALLVPRNFYLRNSLSRISGQGQAKEYRRITGVSNSGTGGVANQNTFFSSTSASASFGGVTLNRPSKISYAADRHVVPYVEQGISDSVSVEAQFAGMGYTDLRQLSHTAALWAHMIGEERNLLNGRGSGTGYLGAITAPAISNWTSAAATTTGGTLVGGTDTLYFKITVSTSFGESVATAEGSRAVSGSNNSVTITAPSSLPASVVAWNIYSGTSTGVYTNKTTVVGSSGTVLTAGTGTYTAPAADGSASAFGYDGLVATLTDSTLAGYTKRLNGALSTTEPGAEFQDAFASLYSSVLADPEQIVLSASVRRALAKSIQQQGNPTGYRLNYELGQDGISVGSVVTSIQNEVTGRMVNLDVHPYLPAGVALVWTKALPFPDSGVAETTQVANVQGADTLVIEWPQIGLTWDLSTYTYGTMLHRAPAWSGAITGITG